MDILKGIAASPGFAAGPAFLYLPQQIEVKKKDIDDPSKEWERLEQALASARREIQTLKMKTAHEVGQQEAEIFEAHGMFIEDPALLKKARNSIQDSRVDAESAWQAAINSYAEQLEDLEDEYLQARAVDIRDVGQRVLRHLLGIQEANVTTLIQPSIIVARDLTPSDTARLDKSHVLAFCTAQGGPTSHTAILARALGRPAVVGLGDDLIEVEANETILVDGKAGTVIRHADKATVEEFNVQLDRYHTRRQAELQSTSKPATTAEGKRIEVVANVGSLADAESAAENGAEGIGLLRTEFLYLDRQSPPDEEDQVEILRDIFRLVGQGPLVVRTLDVGGDKPLPYIDMPKEENPFLGWRAIRMSLDQPEVFQTQLRALLRAGFNRDLRIMFPMIATLSELRQAKELLAQAKAELESQGKKHAETVQVGIMVEVPAAVVMAEDFAKEVNFFSIGTNDLTQYTFAAERANSKVATLSDAAHPAVLRQVSQVIKAAHKKELWVGLCGELAGDEDAIPVLLGLGLDEFSMSPPFIPHAKEVLRRWSIRESRDLAHQALRLESAEAVRKFVRSRTAELK